LLKKLKLQTHGLRLMQKMLLLEALQPSFQKSLEEKIKSEFDNIKVATRDKILNYFISRKLKTLIEIIDEF